MRFLTALSIAAIALAAAGCSEDPEVAKRRFFASGESYFAAQKYKEAAVEYRNALQHDARFGEARFRLSQAAAHTGDAETAVRESVRAADLLPEREDVQLQACRALLGAGAFDDAKTRLLALIDRNSKSAEAHVLLGHALSRLNDPAGAIEEAQKAVELNPGQSYAHAALGDLQLDQGKLKEAEAAYRRAIEVDANAVLPRISLANFYWAQKRTPEAEAELRNALRLDATNRSANLAIATIYLSTGRAPEAEKHLVALSQGPDGASIKLLLADYYARTKRQPEAARALTDVAKSDPSWPQAQSRLAKMQWQAGDKEQAHRTLDEVLKESKAPEPAITKGELLLAAGKTDDALRLAQMATAAHPNHAGAHFLEGAVHERRNEADLAIGAYRKAAALSPRSAAARENVSRLLLQKRQFQDATQMAAEALKIDPRSGSARLLHVQGLIALGNTAAAEAQLKPLMKDAAERPDFQTALGSLRAAQSDMTGARQAFEKAHRLDPRAYDPIAGLVTLDMREGKKEAAQARLKSVLDGGFTEPNIYQLAAQVHFAAGNSKEAESALRRAVELAPNTMEPYWMLAKLYAHEKRTDLALREFEAIAARDPKSVAASTMVGIMLQQQGKTAEARTYYERVVATDPRAAVAANNLAWIYASGDDQLDAALQLARSAKAGMPDSHEVDHTLGWIYYRKGMFDLAIKSYKDSVGRDQGNATYHYHLGLAYAKAGNAAEAKNALTTALKLRPDFEGAADARQLLASLKS